ncbi:MAG: YfiR family protein [Deltaproteobacteria bacterium]|nr:YfiR family protein [Deltaproteobacteria bacterium]
MTFLPGYSPPPRGAARASRRGLFALRAAAALFAALLLAFVSAASISRAEPSPPREYQVKAAFLYTLLKFVEWPAGVVAGAPPPLCIAILGQDPFGDDLEAVRGKSAKGRTVVIKRYRRVEDVKECDLLFISSSERGHLGRILRQLQGSPILTVADQEGFCEAGGMINLITVSKRVAFEINVAAAQRAGLRISSQLLKLARIVVDEQRGAGQ